MIPPARLWLHRLALLLSGSTLFLVFAGGMVTSTGSGLAVPDWPLSYGTLFPPMVGGVFYEHGHRLIAGYVALLTASLAFFAWRVEPRRSVQRLAAAALGAVLLQAGLGGLTVIYLLPTAVSVAHAALANLFFALTVILAFLTSARQAAGSPPDSDTGRKNRPLLWGGVALAVYVQMLLGALMRHTGAGLAIPDFPLSLGRLVPPLETWPVIIHFSHRLGALAVTLLALYALAGVQQEARRVRLPARLLAALVPVQILLGGFTVWSGKNPLVTSLHVVCGTLALGLAVWATSAALAFRVPRPGRILPSPVPRQEPA